MAIVVVNAANVVVLVGVICYNFFCYRRLAYLNCDYYLL